VKTITLPYSPYSGPVPRPYLVLHFTGLNGAEGNVVGLLDSGADTSCLPLGFASLMGYTPGDLEIRTCVGVGGTTDVHAALKPVQAHVTGIPETTFEILPTFLPDSEMPIWGRMDFFNVYGVSFNEPQQEFTLTRH
jgi:hypothetical protein